MINRIVFAIFCLYLVSSAVGEEAPDLTRLYSDSEAERAKTFDLFKVQRKSQIGDLITAVSDPKKQMNQEGTEKAIALLGILRAEEATQVLADNIGYPYFRHKNAGLSMEPAGGLGTHRKNTIKQLPAVVALVSIGEVSADDVIHTMISSDIQFVRDACEVVLTRLIKHDTVEAKVTRLLASPDIEELWGLHQALQRISKSRSQKEVEGE